MVSVSNDPPEVEAAFRAGVGARWTFLSDVERRYVEELDLLETTDIVHRPYVPEELRRDLRAITKAIRPDWEVPKK